MLLLVVETSAELRCALLPKLELKAGCDAFFILCPGYALAVTGDTIVLGFPNSTPNQLRHTGLSFNLWYMFLYWFGFCGTIQNSRNSRREEPAVAV